MQFETFRVRPDTDWSKLALEQVPDINQSARVSCCCSSARAAYSRKYWLLVLRQRPASPAFSSVWRCACFVAVMYDENVVAPVGIISYKFTSKGSGDRTEYSIAKYVSYYISMSQKTWLLSSIDHCCIASRT
eukprot:6213938-Pleurochrysis_carterae.AAC.4